jgi:amidase
MNTFQYLSVQEIVEGFRSKQFSPAEILETHLQRIQFCQPKLNAFVHLDAENARAQARAAESAVTHGELLGPLHGVPVTIKSSIDVAGWPCPCGSLLRKDYVATEDAPLVSRLKSAGE